MKIKLVRIVLSAAVVGCFAAQASAANIGNWSGSDRSWNNSAMSTLKSTMLGAGHTVEADEAITAGNLANDNLFIVGEGLSSPGAGELSILSSWVSGGGRLLVFADSGFSGGTNGNAILSGIGSFMSFSSSDPVNGTLQAGNFASNNVYNIVGQSIDTSPGSAVSGGSMLAGSYIHYQQIGSGFVYAFADRSDHNYFSPTSSNVNGQLFLNIAGPIPEPESYAMLLAGLGMLGFFARRRKQDAA